MVTAGLTVEARRARLAPPEGRVRMVLDTDTYNEIDDQFAVVQALLSRERLAVEALYAAPFHNDRSDGPGDGMEKSYEEILRLLERLGLAADGRVLKGSSRYLPDRHTPVESAVTADLLRRAATGDGPLYVVAIGAITNVASALLLDPSLAARIVVVWLGGQPHHYPTAREFNLKQDVPAAQVILDSGVPFVQVPCAGVASHLLTTVPELEALVRGHGAIADYLCDIFADYHKGQPVWSKEVWDISAVAWLLDAAWVPTAEVPSPVLTDAVTWADDAGRHCMRVATAVKRDAIFGDLFSKLYELERGARAPAWG